MQEVDCQWGGHGKGEEEGCAEPVDGTFEDVEVLGRCGGYRGKGQPLGIDC